MEAKVEAWVAQFDRLVQLHGQASGMANDRQAHLALRPEPDRRLLPKVHRSMDAVDDGLVDIFRRLASGQAPWPLFLHGLVGTGKTRASLCLCDFADSAVYWSIDSLCDYIMNGQTGEVQTEWGYLEKKALAVLDEIGQREKVGDLHASTLQKFLDAREYHADGVGIYVSNLDPDELSELYDDRIISRLLAGTVHHLKGPDRRQT